MQGVTVMASLTVSFGSEPLLAFTLIGLFVGLGKKVRRMIKHTKKIVWLVAALLWSPVVAAPCESSGNSRSFY